MFDNSHLLKTWGCLRIETLVGYREVESFGTIFQDSPASCLFNKPYSSQPFPLIVLAEPNGWIWISWVGDLFKSQWFSSIVFNMDMSQNEGAKLQVFNYPFFCGSGIPFFDVSAYLI